MFFPNRFFSLFAAVLFAAFVLAGCDDGSTNDTPVPFTGTWTSTYEDSYTITGTSLSYGYSVESPSYSGTIRYVKYFTDNSGVIIFEYDADGKQVYYDYDESYNVTGGPHDPPGNFIATYFKNLGSTSGDFATAYDMSKPHGCETTTLEAAKATFTLDAGVNTFATYYGTYSKQ